MSAVLLESRPYRPFKSQDEYLVAMREDLAEWLQEMYPTLNITAETFMDRLETGVALCEHANGCKALAYEYVQKKQAKQIMLKSITGSVATAQSLINISDVNYITMAKPGTFFARDNLSNFIHWCRHSLKIIECLLFESDDLILRKNEKHVILCLLEVARKGAKFGVPAPMLVQMERQIDREIAADQRRLGGQNASCQTTTSTSTNGDHDDDDDSEAEGEAQPPMIYGPLPQIVTNDLKSLDEMVRDLVENCTCPTQFKMIRLSEGKYRIGDTNTLIFVRILRNHVMVRVGGGWDTLSHYLEKHDPCRCRSQHKATLGARLVSKPGAHDLAGAHVYYDRSTVSPHSITNNTAGNVTTDSARGTSHLGPPMNSLNRSRSRSPTAAMNARRSVSPNLPRRNQQGTMGVTGISSAANSLNVGSRTRSRSPTPYYTSTHTTKLSSPNANSNNTSPRKSSHNINSGPASLPMLQSSYISNGGVARKKSTTNNTNANNGTMHVSTIHIAPEPKQKQQGTTEVSATNGDATTDQQSDNGSEVSDEGYRSLGILDKSNGQRYHPSSQSVHSPNSSDDAEYNEQHDSVIDIPTDDDTNDCGLRRTNYSLQIYGEDSPAVKPKISTASRQNSTESTISNQQQQPQSLLHIKPTTTTKSTPQLSSNTINNNAIVVSNNGGAGSRGGSPRKTLGGAGGAGIKLQHGTWNGMGIGNGVKSRGALTVDTFMPQGPQSLTTDFTPTQPHQSPYSFKRNSVTRMTTGGGGGGGGGTASNRSRRGSQSAHTSPNKTNNLKHDLLKTLQQCGDNVDDDQLLEKVHRLIKQHSSASLYAVLNGGEQAAGGGELGVKSRRDSRADVQGTTRIPAPAQAKKVA